MRTPIRAKRRRAKELGKDVVEAFDTLVSLRVGVAVPVSYQKFMLALFNGLRFLQHENPCKKIVFDVSHELWETVKLVLLPQEAQDNDA